MPAYRLLYLDQEEVAEAGGADMEAAVRDTEEVFRLHHLGQTVLPSKVVLRWGDSSSELERGRINGMPGYVGGTINMAGIKWIASFPANPFRHGLPRGSGLIIINDPDRGVPLAVMDGTLISAMRTGAVTGVAAKYLARSDSRVVALLGAGVQSRTQLMALRVALPSLERVYVVDPVRERAETFAQEMEARLGLSVTVAEPEAALRGADAVVSATTSSEPIIRQGWLPSGVFYSHVGGYECEFDVVREADRRITDNWSEIKHRGIQTFALMHQQGLLKDGDIECDLGAIVAGDHPGRRTPQERIIFLAVGMGIEDVAVAARVFRTASDRGLGRWLPLWNEPFAL